MGHLNWIQISVINARNVKSTISFFGIIYSTTTKYKPIKDLKTQFFFMQSID
jgi:hypothetical protein